VSPGKGSVNRGLKEAEKKGYDTVFFEPGIHTVKGDYVVIDREMKICGAGRDRTIVKGGGFKIKGKKKEGKNVVLLKDMTISETKYKGVYGKNGLSWLCDSMTITQCGDCGVAARNTKGRLINCVITQCGHSGVNCYENALIGLEGDQTKVNGNVTGGDSGSTYGLETSDTSSIIHLLFPLTKESVSTNNGGGGNYGGDGTIETVNSKYNWWQLYINIKNNN